MNTALRAFCSVSVSVLPIHPSTSQLFILAASHVFVLTLQAVWLSGLTSQAVWLETAERPGKHAGQWRGLGQKERRKAGERSVERGGRAWVAEVKDEQKLSEVMDTAEADVRRKNSAKSRVTVRGGQEQV